MRYTTSGANVAAVVAVPALDGVDSTGLAVGQPGVQFRVRPGGELITQVRRSLTRHGMHRQIRNPIVGPIVLPERQQAQALVELALVSAVMLVVLFAVFEGVWWAYAQNVVTAAVQDGAQRASAQNGDLKRGQQRAQDLLNAGLGPSAALVQLQVNEDPRSVRLSATGQWPVANIAGVPIALPLHAEARMLREQWQP